MNIADVNVATDVGRLLLVDDDEDVSEVYQTLQFYAKGGGYQVDLATSLSEAEDLLERRRYFMVVFDVIFAEEEITGDVFVLDHQQLLRGARPVVITAHDPALVAKEKQLRRMGIPLLIKGSTEFWPALRKLSSDELAVRRTGSPITAGPPNTDEWLSSKAGRLLAQKAQERLVRWLADMDDPESESFFYGGGSYSATSLLKEIEAGSAVGIEHIDMLLDLLDYRLENASDDKEQ